MMLTTPESHQKNSTKIGQPYNCHWTKESFVSWKKVYMHVFQNHRKQANINVVFHHFAFIGLNSKRTTINLNFFNPSTFAYETADFKLAYLQSAKNDQF